MTPKQRLWYERGLAGDKPPARRGGRDTEAEYWYRRGRGAAKGLTPAQSRGFHREEIATSRTPEQAEKALGRKVEHSELQQLHHDLWLNYRDFRDSVLRGQPFAAQAQIDRLYALVSDFNEGNLHRWGEASTYARTFRLRYNDFLRILKSARLNLYFTPTANTPVTARIWRLVLAILTGNRKETNTFIFYGR